VRARDETNVRDNNRLKFRVREKLGITDSMSQILTDIR